MNSLTSNELVQELPQGALDIVGDIHGEVDALHSLLEHLGYDSEGNHQEGRKLVFVGDLCDRGPDSPAVIFCIQRMVELGNAFCILGNHELNLLLDDPKSGSGWFFDGMREKDAGKYGNPVQALAEQKAGMLKFLKTLPIVLLRDDIRVVHAAWCSASIEALTSFKGDVLDLYQADEKSIENIEAELQPLIRKELEGVCLDDPSTKAPRLKHYPRMQAMRQMMNRVKLFTSGAETAVEEPFFAGHKWRYAERLPWWNSYEDDVPVVFGHYWRAHGELKRPPFMNIENDEWFGARGNCYCIDFSVGARYEERQKLANEELMADRSMHRLAGLRWPEREVVFDCGERIQLTGK